MDENKKDKRKNIIILILVLIIALGGFFLFNRKDDDKPLDVDTEQSSYVKPEKPVDRSKNVTLPGWGAFNIPANAKEITQGFEFHNPEENFWYVDKMSVEELDLGDKLATVEEYFVGWSDSNKKLSEELRQEELRQEELRKKNL